MREGLPRQERSVSVYNDKHLSYSFDKAHAMVAASKQMGFPMLGGSSLPVTWRLPDIEIPLGAHIEEALMVGVGGSDAMDFHALEGLQCMVERRKGGETGVESVQDSRWRQSLGSWRSRHLVQRTTSSALSRSDTPLGLTVKDGRTQDLVGSGSAPVAGEASRGIFHSNIVTGLERMLMLDGAVEGFQFAARIRGAGLLSTQFFLSPVPNVTYSACLVSKIEQMFISPKSTLPNRKNSADERHPGELPRIPGAGEPASADASFGSRVRCGRRIAIPENLSHAAAL